MKIKNILLILFFLLLLHPVLAQEKSELYLFHGEGCINCAEMDLFLEGIKANYPNIEIKKFEVYFNEENRKLFEEVSKGYKEEVKGVPTIFLGEKIFVGASTQTQKDIEKQMKFCSENLCNSPKEKINNETESTKKLTIPAVISAAAVDAINPCAFTVLILLLTAILLNHNRKKALFAGISFTIAIFISYFLMGLGLYSAIQYSGLTHFIFIATAILAILVGLFNLKDYFWYGKLFIMEVPRSWRPRMKTTIQKVASVPGAFLVGFIVSLFLLPCTSGPYIVILGLLAKTTTKNYAILLLILYNLIFILPMLIITGLVYFGITTTEKAERWRTTKLKTLHLIAGIVLILLGIGMLIALKFKFI